MTIKELKDLLNTIMPSNDVLVSSVIKVVGEDGKEYDIDGITYNHVIFDSEGENLMIFVKGGRNEQADRC